MKTSVLLKATAFFAAVLLMTGCIFDSLNPEQTSRTATFGASFVNASEDGPQTKVSLTQDGKNIDLAWEKGDEIELLTVYNGVMTKQTVTIDVEPGSDSKQATFTFDLPTPVSGVTHFNLYGVYGGTVNETSGIVTLPNPDNATSSSLKEVQVVLVFELMNIELANPSGNAVFKHIGSLFNIKLKNTSTTTASGLITEASLKATTDIPAYNANNFDYDIIGKTFGGTQTKTLTFKPVVPSTFIDPEGILEFWAWVPMENAGNWPALDCSVNIAGASDILYSNAKTGVASGQAYFLYATVDGTTLAKVGESAITNPSSVTIDGREFQRIADTRDGSVYKIVTINTQTWMAENLKYLPDIHIKTNGSLTDYRYYVYNYDGTDVAAAKACEYNGVNIYQTYGVLYNWPAAMAGAASSDGKPSDVQGVCPDGWHLPSDEEWKLLINYLGGTHGGAGKKMKETGTTHWQSPNEGATNESGFTGLPGGHRHINGFFDNINIYGYWWSATEYDANRAILRRLYYNNSTVESNSNDKRYGFSVRCVKD